MVHYLIVIDTAETGMLLYSWVKLTLLQAVLYTCVVHMLAYIDLSQSCTLATGYLSVTYSTLGISIY